MIRKFTKFLGALFLIAQFSVFGQVSSYTFTQFSGSFTAITGGTVFGSTTSDDERFIDPGLPLGGTTLIGPGIPIGFNFTYNGSVFDRIAINNNGWISLGNSTITPNPININSSSSYNAISATSTAPGVLQNRIAAFSRDLQGQTGSSLRVETIGTAPNQTCVVQWSNYRKFNATGDDFSFQIRLMETSNNIQVVYGVNTTTATVNNTAQVGLRGVANTDYNNRSVLSTGVNNWSTSTTGTINTASTAFSTTLTPSSGQVYQWGPVGCALTPTIGTISGVTSTTINAVNSYTLSATNGTNIAWYTASNIAGPYTPVPSATAAIANVTATPAGTIYLYSSANNAGCSAATSNTLSINVLFPGNDVCSPIALTTGTNPAVNLFGATTQSGEVVPPASGCSTNNGWCNSTLNNTMWFTYVAPASGNVSIQTPSFDTQLAIWATASCTNLIGNATPTAPASATLIAANDDDPNYTTNGGVNFSSFVKAYCLTPGQTYYIQLDSYSAATSTSSTTIVITDLGVINTSFSGLNASYCLPTTLTSSLVPVTAGGTLTVNGGTTTVTSFDPNVYGVGTHTVTYNLGATCLISNSVTTVANTPTITASAVNATVCAASTVSLTASGATTYSWSPAGGTGASTTASPTVNTTYTVIGTTSGCSDTANVSVTVNAGPSLTVTPSSAAICANATATLVANGATTYSWNTGATTQGIAVTPSVTTIYTVTGVGTNSCSSSVAFTQTVNPNPTVTATTSNTLICVGNSATLTASGATTYSWTPAVPLTGVISPTANTTYTVIGTDSNGCTNTTTVLQSVSPCTGVESILANSTGINLFPNPTSGDVTLVINTVTSGMVVEVYDVVGKQVATKSISEIKTTLSLSELASGVYTYKVLNSNGVAKIGKIVKE